MYELVSVYVSLNQLYWYHIYVVRVTLPCLIFVIIISVII